jgi:hypothetical protein
MKSYNKIIDKLKKIGFSILESDDAEEKDNILLYKSSGGSIDLIITAEKNIVSFITLALKEIESFKIVDRYIKIKMKNNTEHILKEISYDSLDQMLLFLLVEKKQSNKTHNSVNL